MAGGVAAHGGARRSSCLSDHGLPECRGRLDPIRGPKRQSLSYSGLQLWRSAYRAALARWRDGNRDVRFPPGSYWLPVFHGAEVETSTGPPVAI